MHRLDTIINLLKGGPGSGHHGHSSIPGQRGGSAKGDEGPFEAVPRGEKVFINGEELKQKDIADRTKFGFWLTERAKNKEYTDALEKFHGLKLNASSNINDIMKTYVNEQLASIPEGTREYMRQNNIKVSLLTTDERPIEKFTVGSNTFEKWGHADSINNELLMCVNPALQEVGAFGLRNESRVTEVIKHETGHFAFSAILSMGAMEDKAYSVADMKREAVRDAVVKFGFESTEAIAAKAERDRAVLYLESFGKIKDIISNFQAASNLEGGITWYSKSYMGTEAGNRYDVKELNEPPIMWDKIEIKGRAGSSRFANENFAEIYHRMNKDNPTTIYGKASRKDNLKELKSKYPKTMEAYLKMEKLLKRIKYPKAKVA